MHKTWIHEQTERNISQWDNVREIYYPNSSEHLRDPRKYVTKLCQECNYLDAVKLIDWQSYLDNGWQILDMGCGGGWLSGYLSTFEPVGTIYALDSSRYCISNLVIHVAKEMGGKPEKIVPIEGLFAPLLLQANSLNVVCASSALHHAENLENVLKEARRVLKKDGLLFILNETPRPWLRYALSLTLCFVKIMRKVIIRDYESASPSISACGYLYDPYLGDKSYPLWYWKEAIRRSGFSLVEVIDTGLPTIKGDRGAGLTHFICRAS
jgi:SAM-dependent methyltransferase